MDGKRFRRIHGFVDLEQRNVLRVLGDLLFNVFFPGVLRGGMNHAMPPPSNSRFSLAAYVVPFALFIAPTMLESNGWLELRYETVYTLKAVVVAAALWARRRHYPPWSPWHSSVYIRNFWRPWPGAR